MRIFGYPGSTIVRTASGHRHSSRAAPVMLGLAAAAISVSFAQAADAYLPIVMPITGFLSVEGGSQRNGAVMALEHAPGGKTVDYPVFATGTSAHGAAPALDQA